MTAVISVVLWCAVILGVLYLLAIMPRMLHKPDTEPFKKVLYAHRGLFDNATNAPENSLAAFQKAVDAGYGIELDIQLTKDKIPVVFHDFTLDRVCGVKGKVCDFTYEELLKFPLSGSDQRIPKFSEVLSLVDGRVPLIVEICPSAPLQMRCFVIIRVCIAWNPSILWGYSGIAGIIRRL